jgi:hypothetical protein
MGVQKDLFLKRGHLSTLRMQARKETSGQRTSQCKGPEVSSGLAHLWSKAGTEGERREKRMNMRSARGGKVTERKAPRCPP